MGRSLAQGLDRPPAIVIGLDCLQGLQSARILSARGVPVVGIAKDRAHYATATRACESILIADTGGPALTDLLERLGPSFRSRPVLFPCQDKNVLLLSRDRHRLEPWYRIALAPNDVVETLMDKASFYDYAQKAGLPLPPTYVLRDRADAERAAAELPYPSILKPSVRLREWSRHTKLKALIAEEPRQLLEHYDLFSQWASVLVAQQLIRGGDSAHVTCNSYYDRRGEPLVIFTTRKIRQWPPRTGQACSSEEVRDDEAVDLTLRVFGGIGYHGLGYLETKRDAVTGQHSIIEANVGRPTGRSATAEAADVELLYTMYCDAVGLPLPVNRKQRYLGVKWLHLLRDLQASGYHWRRGELTVREWWRSISGPRTHAIASWRDPLPFVKAVRSAVPGLPRTTGAARRRA
ncbi:MAG: carboxylate--amine ligase [Euzebyaceae bacterium]|nr:carboxylate--amine ligase [Euzebyaceae bacterium]